MAVDIFQDDDRIVHEPAHAQGKPAQRHDVERKIAEMEEDEGGDDRDGDGVSDDQRARPASEKDENDDDRKKGPHNGLVLEVLDRLSNEGGLV